MKSIDEGTLYFVRWILQYSINSSSVRDGFFETTYAFTLSPKFSSDNVRLIVQSQTGMKVKDEPQVHIEGKSFSFIVSLLFTIVSLFVTVIYYWKEFWVKIVKQKNSLKFGEF